MLVNLFTVLVAVWPLRPTSFSVALQPPSIFLLRAFYVLQPRIFRFPPSVYAIQVVSMPRFQLRITCILYQDAWPGPYSLRIVHTWRT